MYYFVDQIKSSAKGMKQVKNLVGTALFVAIDVVLGSFGKIVVIPKTLEINFSSLELAIKASSCGMVSYCSFAANS